MHQREVQAPGEVPALAESGLYKMRAEPPRSEVQ